jgi:hypothetical protein
MNTPVFAASEFIPATPVLLPPPEPGVLVVPPAGTRQPVMVVGDGVADAGLVADCPD